jgi:hypothetical protein
MWETTFIENPLKISLSLNVLTLHSLSRCTDRDGLDYGMVDFLCSDTQWLGDSKMVGDWRDLTKSPFEKLDAVYYSIKSID